MNRYVIYLIAFSCFVNSTQGTVIPDKTELNEEPPIKYHEIAMNPLQKYYKVPLQGRIGGNDNCQLIYHCVLDPKLCALLETIGPEIKIDCNFDNDN